MHPSIRHFCVARRPGAQDWALPYCVEMGFGLFYFALNPDSADTGGLVTKDCDVPPEGSAEALKLAALAKLPSTRVLDVCPQCKNVTAASAAGERLGSPKPRLSHTVPGLYCGCVLHISCLYPVRILSAHPNRMPYAAQSCTYSTHVACTQHALCSSPL